MRLPLSFFVIEQQSVVLIPLLATQRPGMDPNPYIGYKPNQRQCLGLVTDISLSVTIGRPSTDSRPVGPMTSVNLIFGDIST